jgi:hypothetical protein
MRSSRTTPLWFADEVWAGCEKANLRGRTVTVKIKWANFQISTRSRSMETSIDTRDTLHGGTLGLTGLSSRRPKASDSSA